MRKVFQVLQTLSKSKGFTAVEIMVVVSIIGILSTIGVISYNNIQQDTRNNQRLASATIIAEAIEKYYDKNGNYPACIDLNPLIISELDKEVPYTPRADKTVDPQIKCSALTAGETEDMFAYVSDGTTGTWQLQYRVEPSNDFKYIVSRRTPPAIAWDVPDLKAESKNNTEISLSWTTVKLATGYEYQRSDNGCTAWGSTISLTYLAQQSITQLSPGAQYCFKVRATDGSRHSDFSEPTAAITSPLAPTSTVTKANDTIKVTLGSSSCVGTAAQFSLSSKIGGSPWSEYGTWTTNANLITNIKPVDGATYSYIAKARCVDTSSGIISAESLPGEAGTYSTIATYPLKISVIPAEAATSIGGGVYPADTLISINFVVNDGWYFDHWADTSCATITVMPAAGKTCYAYFSKTKYHLTVEAQPSAGGTVTGTGDYESGKTVNVSKSANTGYSFSSWSNPACGSGSFIMPTADFKCTAIFTVNTPPAPNVTYSHTGDDTRYSWIDNCPTGSFEQYRYLFQSEYYDSSYYSAITGAFKPIDGNGPDWHYIGTQKWAQHNTTYQGFFHTTYVQGRCKITNQESYSDWSNTGQGYFQRDISAPVGPPTWGIYVLASSSYRVHLTATIPTACSAHNSLYAKYDIASYTHPWLGTSNKGWWATFHNGVWVRNDFAYVGNPFSAASDKYIGGTNILDEQGTTAKYKFKIQYKCYNTYSGRSSESTGEYESGELITGAYQ